MSETRVYDTDDSMPLPMSARGERHWKLAIFKRMLESIKNCQQLYKERGAVIVESDVGGLTLLSNIEDCLCHGLVNNDSLAGSAIRQVASLVITTYTSPYDLVAKRLWSILRCCVPEVDVARILRMSHITDDASRARALLRQTLNDGQLGRLFSAVCGHVAVLKEHYEPWSFCRDIEWSATLPQVAQGVTRIHFAMSLLHSSYVHSSLRVVSPSTQHRSLAPVIAVNSGIARPKSRSRSRHKLEKVVKPKPKTLVNHVSFDGEKRSPTSSLSGRQPNEVPLNSNPGRMTICKTRRTSEEQGERSSVKTSTITSDGSINEDDLLPEILSSFQPDQAEEAECEDDPDSDPDEQAYDDSGALERLQTESELGIIDSNVKLSFVHDDSLNEAAMLRSASPVESTSASSIMTDQTNIINESNQSINQLNDEVLRLSAALNASNICAEGRDRELEGAKIEIDALQAQIRTYVDSIQTLSNPDNQGQSTNSGDFNDADDHISSAQFENKLVQMAMMHAELLELNDRLVSSVNLRNRDLERAVGLLKKHAPKLNLAAVGLDAEFRTSRGGQPDHKVKICIPSAFLTGKHTDVHHIYQAIAVFSDFPISHIRRD